MTAQGEYAYGLLINCLSLNYNGAIPLSLQIRIPKGPCHQKLAFSMLKRHGTGHYVMLDFIVNPYLSFWTGNTQRLEYCSLSGNNFSTNC